MEDRPVWLVHNDASGSNDREALEAMESGCADCGLRVAHRSGFPTDDLPTPAMLDAADIGIVTVFAGDGTVNAALDALAGWKGAVLVLPGGTMNLLYHRLFGDRELEDVLRAAAEDRLVPRRPGIISSPLGNAYAGLLAGPGTSWNDVREAIRKQDIVEMAAETREAFVHTLQDEPLRCLEPPLGRAEGYPLLLLEPHDDKIDLYAYHSETAAEFASQLLALAMRDFRQGPHDHIGSERQVTLASVHDAGFGVLLDGEPANALHPTEFRLTTCEVDLLSLQNDD